MLLCRSRLVRVPLALSCPWALVPVTAALLSAAPAGAQQDRGSVTGSVTDSGRAAVQGARVELRPAGASPEGEPPLSTQTSPEGEFTFGALKPGPYTLTISSIGFETYTTTLQVAAGNATAAAAVLQLASTHQEVTVRPEREVGEAEALNVQRTALNIEQVLPSEVINSLPNVNIADAVGRMPSVSVERDEGEAKYIQIRGTEPRLNNVTVDGMQLPSPESVRNVKLDTIPADLVESIQVNKTMIASMDADGIGGSVNLVTRSAADEPYFAIQGLLGHTPINNGRDMDEVFATYGRRLLADKKLGVLVTGSYDWNGRGINDVEPAQNVNSIVALNPDGSTTPTGQTVNAPNSIDIRNYFYDRSRYGLGGTLDYRQSDRTFIYLKSLFSYFHDYGEDSILTLNAGNFISSTATDATGSTGYNDVYRRPTQEIWDAIVGVHHEFSNSFLDAKVALGEANITGGYDYLSFGGLGPGTDANGNPLQNGVSYSYNNADIFLPHLAPVSTPGGASIYDPAQYTLSNINLQDNHTFQRNISGQADYASNYSQKAIFGSWQIGFKARDVDKTQIYNSTNASGAAPPMTSFLTDRGSGHNYYSCAYQPGPNVSGVRIL